MARARTAVRPGAYARTFERDSTSGFDERHSSSGPRPSFFVRFWPLARGARIGSALRRLSRACVGRQDIRQIVAAARVDRKTVGVGADDGRRTMRWTYRVHGASRELAVNRDIVRLATRFGDVALARTEREDTRFRVRLNGPSIGAGSRWRDSAYLARLARACFDGWSRGCLDRPAPLGCAARRGCPAMPVLRASVRQPLPDLPWPSRSPQSIA